MKKNTKIILAVGAVGVVAYLILRKKKSGMTNFTGYSYATGAVTQTKNVDCKALQSQWESLRSTLSVTQTASQYNNVVDRMNSIATAAGLKCFISFPIYPHVAPAAPTP